MTPLHLAATNGHVPVVKYLCEQGADQEAVCSQGKTPLGWASWHYDKQNSHTNTLTMQYLRAAMQDVLKDSPEKKGIPEIKANDARPAQMQQQMQMQETRHQCQMQQMQQQIDEMKMTQTQTQNPIEMQQMQRT